MARVLPQAHTPRLRILGTHDDNHCRQGQGTRYGIHPQPSAAHIPEGNGAAPHRGETYRHHTAESTAMGRQYTHTTLHAMDSAGTQTQLEQRHLRRHRETVIHCGRNACQSHHTLPHMGDRRQTPCNITLSGRTEDKGNKLEQQPLLAWLGAETRLIEKRRYKHGSPYRGRIVESDTRAQARGPCAVNLRFHSKRTIHDEGN